MIILIIKKYWGESWRLKETCCHLDLSERPSANAGVKYNNIIMMDEIKLMAKNEKKLETLIQAVRIYSDNIGMEFSIKKMSHTNICQNSVLVHECSSHVELRVKVNTDLSMGKGTLYAHWGVPWCAGSLVHSLCDDWLPAQEWLC